MKSKRDPKTPVLGPQPETEVSKAGKLLVVGAIPIVLEWLRKALQRK